MVEVLTQILWNCSWKMIQVTNNWSTPDSSTKTKSQIESDNVPWEGLWYSLPVLKKGPLPCFKLRITAGYILLCVKNKILLVGCSSVQFVEASTTFSFLESSSTHEQNAGNVVMHCSLEYQVQGGLLEAIKRYQI